MTLIATIPVLVMILGALLFCVSGNAKIVELGRIMFAFGLLVALSVTASGHMVLRW